MAAVVFSTEPELIFAFNESYDPQEIQRQLFSLPYPGLGTATGSALDFVRTELLLESQGWRGNNTVILLVSDGLSQEESGVVSLAANRLHSAIQGDIYAVGVGESARQPNGALNAELKTIVSIPASEFLLTVASFSGLSSETFRDNFVNQTCRAVIGATGKIINFYLDIDFDSLSAVDLTSLQDSIFAALASQGFPRDLFVTVNLYAGSVIVELIVKSAQVAVSDCPRIMLLTARVTA